MGNVPVMEPTNGQHAVPDAYESRARRRRLVIILVVAGVMLVGGIALYWQADNTLDERVRTTKREIREHYSSIDIPATSDAYTAATLNDRSISPFVVALGHGQQVEAEFGRTEIRAKYRVEALGMERCVAVIASGTEPPNEVTLQEGGC